MRRNNYYTRRRRNARYESSASPVAVLRRRPARTRTRRSTTPWTPAFLLVLPPSLRHGPRALRRRRLRQLLRPLLLLPLSPLLPPPLRVGVGVGVRLVALAHTALRRPVPWSLAVGAFLLDERPYRISPLAHDAVVILATRPRGVTRRVPRFVAEQLQVAPRPPAPAPRVTRRSVDGGRSCLAC